MRKCIHKCACTVIAFSILKWYFTFWNGTLQVASYSVLPFLFYLKKNFVCVCVCVQTREKVVISVCTILPLAVNKHMLMTIPHIQGPPDMPHSRLSCLPAIPCSLSFEPVVPSPGIHSLLNPLAHTPPSHMHLFFLVTLISEPGEDLSSPTVRDGLPRLGGLCLKQVSACVLGVFLG